MLRKPAPAAPYLFHNVQKIFQRTEKAVELPNDEYIPLPELFQGLEKLWPVPATPGGLIATGNRSFSQSTGIQ
jgi:hypothetical protein